MRIVEENVESAPVAPSEFARRQRAARAARVAEIDALADRRDEFRRKNAYYYAEIERLAKFFIPPGKSVLEIGCSTGDLLAALRPSRGVGIDISPRTVEIARQKHPGLDIRVGDAEELDLDETFDYVVLSDVVGYLDDVLAALRLLRRVMGPESRLLLTFYNFLWQPALDLGRVLGRKMPVPEQNWLGLKDIDNLLHLAGLEVVQSGTAVLLPIDAGPVSALANRLLARAPGLRHLSLVQYFLARPRWQDAAPPRPRTCSVVVPCKNERGNVADIFARTPDLGAGTELIFVDGNSDDGTVEEIERLMPTRRRTRLIHQGDGKGKGDAVRKGFAAASGDILFILDADLTVPPEDLPHFYRALVEGHGEFVNGTRLVYPMEGEAMRFLNLVGNKFFSVAFTYILGRSIKDTLCGTKVLTREGYQKIADGRAFFGDFDPFGDFDLLFGAARAGLKIVEVPVRYRARTYGDTKIDRFRHGWLLLRMTALAFVKFKLTV
ncbi:MAG TPA: glycosyltransferase [Haliangiales bacterium]|nr:glycosyltransferase [Haliangiales bacterium]